MRAQLHCNEARHGRANAILPRHVVRSGTHLHVSNRNRQFGEFGVVPDFHGSVEHVHIDVNPSPGQVPLALQIAKQALGLVLELPEVPLIALAILDLLLEGLALGLSTLSLEKLLLVVVAVLARLVDLPGDLVLINVLHSSLLL